MSLRAGQTGKYAVGGNQKQFTTFKQMYEDQQVVYGRKFEVERPVMSMVPQDLLKLEPEKHIKIQGDQDARESYMLIPMTKPRNEKRQNLRSPAHGPLRMCRIVEF